MDEILSNGRAYENLRVLTKQVGARLAGSAGMVKAEQWGLKTMKESGAQQAWLQECMVPHWIRGGKDEMWSNTLVSGNDPKKPDARLVRKDYDIAALGNSVGYGPAGMTDEVMLVNSFDELEKRNDEVKGKIMFYNTDSIPLMSIPFSLTGMPVSTADRAPAVRQSMAQKQ
ncbi:MAG: hypothetical protein V9F01_00130 [Chitinophagaceae bacterium]